MSALLIVGVVIAAATAGVVVGAVAAVQPPKAPSAFGMEVTAALPEWKVVTKAEGGWDEGKSTAPVVVRIVNIHGEPGSYRIIGRVDPAEDEAGYVALLKKAEDVAATYNAGEIA